MAQLEDTTTFQAFWAAAFTTTQDRFNKVFVQFCQQTERFAMSQLIDALDGAPDGAKNYVWQTWAEKADLSGANIYDILALKSEPPDAVMHIVKRWLEQVKTGHLGLDDMKVLTKDSSGLLTYEDVERFWLRWLQTKDLRTVTLVDFAKAIRGFSPEMQLSLLNTYVVNCPNINTYGSKARSKAREELAELAVQRCPLFSSNSTAVQPKFRVGQRVHIAGLTGLYVIASVYQQSGVYYYWPENGQKYYPETLVEAA